MPCQPFRAASWLLGQCYHRYCFPVCILYSFLTEPSLLVDLQDLVYHHWRLWVSFYGFFFFFRKEDLKWWVLSICMYIYTLKLYIYVLMCISFYWFVDGEVLGDVNICICVHLHMEDKVSIAPHFISWDRNWSWNSLNLELTNCLDWLAIKLQGHTCLYLPCPQPHGCWGFGLWASCLYWEHFTSPPPASHSPLCASLCEKRKGRLSQKKNSPIGQEKYIRHLSVVLVGCFCQLDTN